MNGTSTGELLMRRYLDILLPFEHIDNYRPDWLRNPRTGCNLEIDRYYPTLRVGFEFNGDQHYRDTNLDSASTQANDKIKAGLCRDAGVKVIDIRAVDLIACRMRNAVKRACHWYNQRHQDKPITYQGKRGKAQVHEHKDTLRGLDHEATQYRDYLKERFPATVTARMKRSQVRARAAAMEWVDKREPSA